MDSEIGALFQEKKPEDIQAVKKRSFLDELDQCAKERKETKKKAKKKKTEAPKEDDPLVLSRTVFVANVPISCIENKANCKEFKRLFSGIGKVSRIRFRSIAFAVPTTKRKAAVLSGGMLHPNRDTCHAYIVFVDAAHVKEALSLNGTMFLSKHLRVDICDGERNRLNKKRTIFVGNLAFDIEDEELWTHFGRCGGIENVKIIRDKDTNFGKGFAYVEFKTAESYQAALMMAGSELRGRKLRITKYSGIKIKKDSSKPRAVKMDTHPKTNSRPAVTNRTRARKQ